jgi:putative type I restriction enzyme HindVIIP R protein
MNARINELLKQSIKSDGVINLFSDIKEEFSLFDPKFLQDVANMKEKNLAVELLKKLIAEQVSVYRRTNIVKSEKFSEIMQRAINAYLNGMLTNEEVIEEINQENQPSIGDSLKVVLSNKGIWLVSICIMMVLGSTVTLSTFMPVALQNMYGIDLKVCGTIASMLTLGNYIGSITGPIVFSKIKNVKVFVSGAAVLSFAGIIMCWRFPSIFVLHILVLYTGIMLGASMPIFLSAPVLLEGLGTKYAGSAAGVISTLQLLGAVLIPTYILTPIAGENYSLLFMLASICMVIMFLCGLLLPQFGNNQK